MRLHHRWSSDWVEIRWVKDDDGWGTHVSGGRLWSIRALGSRYHVSPWIISGTYRFHGHYNRAYRYLPHGGCERVITDNISLRRLLNLYDRKCQFYDGHNNRVMSFRWLSLPSTYVKNSDELSRTTHTNRKTECGRERGGRGGGRYRQKEIGEWNGDTVTSWIHVGVNIPTVHWAFQTFTNVTL